jgi:hypothetical protein
VGEAVDAQADSAQEEVEGSAMDVMPMQDGLKKPHRRQRIQPGLMAIQILPGQLVSVWNWAMMADENARALVTHKINDMVMGESGTPPTAQESPVKVQDKKRMKT